MLYQSQHLNIATAQGLAAAAIMLLIAIAFLFYGWHTYRISLVVGGMLVGAAIGATLARHIGINEWIVALPAALVSGILALALIKVGVFLIGASFGAIVVSAFQNQFSSENIFFAVLALAAIAGGILAILIWRPMIVVSLALVGASLVLSILDMVIRHFRPANPALENQHPIILLVILFVLTFMGVYVQRDVLQEKSEKSA